MKHAFFTRNGGVSQGLYKSLNVSFSSNDLSKNVIANRQLIIDEFSANCQLITLHQQHSDAVMLVDQENLGEISGNFPKGDGLVTNLPNIIIAILTADCSPVLLFDQDNRVIGAAHCGWRGAHSNLLSNVINQMQELGAAKDNINALIGPTIVQKSYEVDNKFYQKFLDENATNSKFFYESSRELHYQFDLPAYVENKLLSIGITEKNIHNINLDTYQDADNFFSYRRATHHNEDDYGRQLSAIAINK
ncbi:MAG: peptidoglycan editing factor PgeF [Pseudomonadota bacterium]